MCLIVHCFYLVKLGLTSHIIFHETKYLLSCYPKKTNYFLFLSLLIMNQQHFIYLFDIKIYVPISNMYVLERGRSFRVLLNCLGQGRLRGHFQLFIGTFVVYCTQLIMLNFIMWLILCVESVIFKLPYLCFLKFIVVLFLSLLGSSIGITQTYVGGHISTTIISFIEQLLTHRPLTCTINY